MIVARLIAPQSKLATARSWHPDTALTSLGQMLGVTAADARALYHAMDWLRRRQPRMEMALANRHLREGTLALYDLTSTYFEGHTCPLAQFGHSRDGKKGKVQIVFGLVCNVEGCPVAVEVFEGNTGDPTTVAPVITKLRQRFHLRRVVLVGDRGLLTDARIREDLKPVEGLDWITALRHPTVRTLVDSGALDLGGFAHTDLIELNAPAYPDELPATFGAGDARDVRSPFAESMLVEEAAADSWLQEELHEAFETPVHAADDVLPDDLEQRAGTRDNMARLNLRLAYIEQRNLESACDILTRVINEGDDRQKQEARELLARIA